MNMKLTRRQFGQMAIATTTVAALGTLFGRTFAQTPDLVILGIRSSIATTNDSITTEVDSTANINEINSTTATSVTQSIVEQSVNLETGRVNSVLTTPPVLVSGEQLSGFTTLRNGTLIAAVTNISNRGEQPTRLITLGASPITLTILGIERQETLLSLVPRIDGGLSGIVSYRNGMPPFTLVNINLQTGEITNRVILSENQRINNLVECPNGNLYRIDVGQRGETNLVLIDNSGNQQTTPLIFNGQPWNSGFSSLVCSASNQLIALGARRYESPKYIHTIDKDSGVITRLTDFDVAKIAIQI
ncbi:hypothetical protein [Iningainema tapete]|uniref:Uncharacterized protein n=1 Tax=Iningainema tapete BLCC-T55 TaxID=2748662 RepID=A0A8J7C7F5_9CYAN|nr:hypothetical protein [Iningainema tapete]MBD2775589.1 hypothetical protein [Iningainema tapete BLCC-T55]